MQISEDFGICECCLILCRVWSKIPGHKIQKKKQSPFSQHHWLEMTYFIIMFNNNLLDLYRKEYPCESIFSYSFSLLEYDELECRTLLVFNLNIAEFWTLTDHGIFSHTHTLAGISRYESTMRISLGHLCIVGGVIFPSLYNSWSCLRNAIT